MVKIVILLVCVIACVYAKPGFFDGNFFGPMLPEGILNTNDNNGYKAGGGPSDNDLLNQGEHCFFSLFVACTLISVSETKNIKFVVNQPPSQDSKASKPSPKTSTP